MSGTWLFFLSLLRSWLQLALLGQDGVDGLVVVLVDGVAVDGEDDLEVGGGHAVLILFTCRFSIGWHGLVDVDVVDVGGVGDFVDLVLVEMFS